MVIMMQDLDSCAVKFWLARVESGLLSQKYKIVLLHSVIQERGAKRGVYRMHLLSGNCRLMTSIIYRAIMLLPMLVMDIN